MSLLARARRPDSPPLSRSTPVNGTFDYPELLVTYTPSLCKWVGPSVRYGLFFFTLKDDLTSDTAPAQRAVVYTALFTSRYAFGIRLPSTPILSHLLVRNV